MSEQRRLVSVPKPSFRRDLNELLLYRNGQVEAGKFWSSVGYGIVAYWLITVPERIWQDWFASVMLASALIAPDFVMKVVNTKSGGGTKTETSAVTVEQTSVTTKP